uniref:Uncharacterized protein n=1 Tax=Cyanoderma ruficeps TaxID=181631 RepID=A0A8C3QSQ2_9PASS
MAAGVGSFTAYLPVPVIVMSGHETIRVLEVGVDGDPKTAGEGAGGSSGGEAAGERPPPLPGIVPGGSRGSPFPGIVPGGFSRVSPSRDRSRGVLPASLSRDRSRGLLPGLPIPGSFPGEFSPGLPFPESFPTFPAGLPIPGSFPGGSPGSLSWDHSRGFLPGLPVPGSFPGPSLGAEEVAGLCHLCHLAPPFAPSPQRGCPRPGGGRGGAPWGVSLMLSRALICVSLSNLIYLRRCWLRKA